MPATLLALAAAALLAPCAYAADAAASLASQYSLSTSTAFPFPTATLAPNGSQDLITQQWSLAMHSIEQGGDDLAFVPDPFPSAGASAAPVLRVTYPAGSYSHQTGGAQFINLWNESTPLESAVLTYELAFASNFQWVMGGKLPGLRGGPEIYGCSGGRPSNGTACWSARVMWRTDGAGEIYTYTPITNSFCAMSGVDCNSDDYGTSIQRGKVTFVTGQWQKITMFIQMNNPPNVANGYMALYYNDVEMISQPNIQIRAVDDLGIAGMFFSTFFGGSNSSWSTPNETYTYFRNIQLYGGTGASTRKAGAAACSRASWAAVVAALGFALVASALS